jgi:hypothetical protein
MRACVTGGQRCAFSLAERSQVLDHVLHASALVRGQASGNAGEMDFLETPWNNPAAATADDFRRSFSTQWNQVGADRGRGGRRQSRGASQSARSVPRHVCV